MDVFNGNLETIETSCFGYLYLGTESLNLAKEQDGAIKKPYIDSRAANHINKLDINSEWYALKKLLAEFLDLCTNSIAIVTTQEYIKYKAKRKYVQTPLP